MRKLTLMLIAGVITAALSGTSALAAGGLTSDDTDKTVTARQKAAEKTQAYKLRKVIPKQQPRSGSRPVPDSGLTDQDVDRKIQAEIDATSPCAYYYQRSLYCTYQLTDQPADPKKKPAPAAGLPGVFRTRLLGGFQAAAAPLRGLPSMTFGMMWSPRRISLGVWYPSVEWSLR